MKIDIILAGVGGQGILSIAAAIGQTALLNNLYIKQSEVHGMSQRGGAVMSHLRISDKPVASDLIPAGEADLIISVEPMEALRYMPYLSSTGWVITNSQPFENIPNYPEIQKIMDALNALPRKIVIDADPMAQTAGSIKSSNMVVLGASVPFLQMSYDSIKKGIEAIFGAKGQSIIDLNLKALQMGYEFAEKRK
ncbi:MAG TPA: indolepyruvate oxidoreductase subunit beta [Bacteroidales bacterium]|nr:indolepyruvate oxidoreductase subunit beta [Bacteroidales bacterium]